MIEMLAACTLVWVNQGTVSPNEFPPIKFLQGYKPAKSTAAARQYTREYKIKLELVRKGIERQFGPGYAYREGGYGWGFGEIHKHAGRLKSLNNWARKAHPRRWQSFRPTMTINVLPLIEHQGGTYFSVPGIAAVTVQVEWSLHLEGRRAKAAYLRLSRRATFLSSTYDVSLLPDGRASGAMNSSHFSGIWKAAGMPAKRGKPAKVTQDLHSLGKRHEAIWNCIWFTTLDEPGPRIRREDR
ncbi:MAG: hypothetical protein H0W86_02050 [Armatimonadetes bacterium]|nr:hypothetical protein [Armatimonadota bacterium]